MRGKRPALSPARPATCRPVAWPVLAGLLAAAVLLVWPGAAKAQHTILPGDMTRRVFYVECAGSINSAHTFTGVRLQITVTHTGSGARNPLQVVVESMPALAKPDSFYLNSDEMSMEVLAGALQCRLANPGTRPTDLHFYYMSPALYGDKTAQRDKERMRHVDRHAKPLKIVALEAELVMHFTANSVSGTIRMTGQDQLGRKPARYLASFQGQEYVHARPAH